MSWTERRGMLEKFYVENIEAVAAVCAEKGEALFPLKPDSTKDSYYSQRAHTRAQFTSLRSASLQAELILSGLGSYQTDLGKQVMPPLIRKILGLAPEFTEMVEQEAEVSPLMYVMF
tara:strand:+ start:433 stop:783 length:351 start_codon:yes stop_codon:yes gene_type:complete